MYNLKINNAIISLSNSFKEAKNDKINGSELVSWMKDNINFLGKVKLNINGDLKQLIPLEEPDIEYFRGLDQEKTNKLSKSLSTVLNNFYKKSFTDYNYNRVTRAEKLREYKEKQGRDITLADRIKVTIPFGDIYVSKNKDAVDQSGLKESADAQGEQENLTESKITSTKSLADEQKEQLDYQSEVEGDTGSIISSKNSSESQIYSTKPLVDEQSGLEGNTDSVISSKSYINDRISPEEDTSSKLEEQEKQIATQLKELDEWHEVLKGRQEEQAAKKPNFITRAYMKVTGPRKKRTKTTIADQTVEDIQNVVRRRNELQEQLKQVDQGKKVIIQQRIIQQNLDKMKEGLQTIENMTDNTGKKKDLSEEIKEQRRVDEKKLEDQQRLQTNRNIVEGVSIDVDYDLKELGPLRNKNTDKDDSINSEWDEFIDSRVSPLPSIPPQSRIDNSKSNFDSNMANIEVIIGLDL